MTEGFSVITQKTYSLWGCLLLCQQAFQNLQEPQLLKDVSLLVKPRPPPDPGKPQAGVFPCLGEK
jgi:hypothetical protein